MTPNNFREKANLRLAGKGRHPAHPYPLEADESLRAVLNADNPRDAKVYKFNQVLDRLLLEFVHTKLDLYKKLTEPNVNEMLKRQWVEVFASGISGQEALQGHDLVGHASSVTSLLGGLQTRLHFGVYLSYIGVQPYRPGRYGMERSTRKPANFSGVDGALKIADYEIIKNTRKGLLPCPLALPSRHHIAQSVTGEILG